jgi:large conductance mechanosensitive channel
MAIGVIIGIAFGKIVSSVVADVIYATDRHYAGRNGLCIISNSAKRRSEPVLLKYGVFINTIIDFIIIAFVLFFGS